MKNFKSLMLFFILLVIGTTSCQKPIEFVEGSGPGSTYKTAATIFMSAKVNGVLVECETVAGLQDVSNLILQLNGVKSSETFLLAFNGLKGVGTYNAADFNSFATYLNGTDALTNNFLADSGTIKITEFTGTTIKGTFDFKASNGNGEQKTITEGKFSSIVVRR